MNPLGFFVGQSVPETFVPPPRPPQPLKAPGFSGHAGFGTLIHLFGRGGAARSDESYGCVFFPERCLGRCLRVVLWKKYEKMVLNPQRIIFPKGIELTVLVFAPKASFFEGPM